MGRKDGEIQTLTDTDEERRKRVRKATESERQKKPQTVVLRQHPFPSGSDPPGLSSPLPQPCPGHWPLPPLWL